MTRNGKKGKRGGRAMPKGAPRALPTESSYPASKRVLLTFPFKQVLLESAAGVGTTYFYRMNSPYDPDFTGVGASAIGLSFWSQVYSNYRVTRCSARVAGSLAASSSGSISQMCLVPVANNATLPSNAGTWALRPGAKSMYLTLSGRTPDTFSASWDIAKVLGVSKSQFTSDMDFSAATSSNPARQAFFAVTLNSSGSVVAASASIFIYVTYEVEFFNPIPLQ